MTVKMASSYTFLRFRREITHSVLYSLHSLYVFKNLLIVLLLPAVDSGTFSYNPQACCFLQQCCLYQVPHWIFSIKKCLGCSSLSIYSPFSSHLFMFSQAIKNAPPAFWPCILPTHIFFHFLLSATHLLIFEFFLSLNTSFFPLPFILLYNKTLFKIKYFMKCKADKTLSIVFNPYQVLTFTTVAKSFTLSPIKSETKLTIIFSTRLSSYTVHIKISSIFFLLFLHSSLLISPKISACSF